MRMKSCEKCKYSDLDYIFDDEIGEEYPSYTCQKGNDVSLDFECEDFKEYKPKLYKKEDTKCDKCKHLDDCKNKGMVLRSTTSYDTREHYVASRQAYCLCKE